ncbi:MAG: DEAD/DEAH box helicase, partial [Gemmatimonadota bacterium]
LEVIRSEYPSVTDFERDFPSICFALATGVGKTRLMGAFISYLHLAHGVRNFFVLAPNLTIYDKLITDFTPNTRKYVFKGIAEFATAHPVLVTGDNYEQHQSVSGDLLAPISINVFNISKINSEVRGGRAPRIKRLSEYVGESYFDYLAALPDLVLLMDESHRYRASAGVRAINELKPILGLELSATPFTEGPRGKVDFRNVAYHYPLSAAMADGFVKEPAVVTRKNFNADGMAPEELERLKLEDGVRLHESVKVELETYARETSNAIVKPFVLVIARDTTHAKQLLDLIQSEAFFEGRYRDKVIQVDSSRTGAEEEEMIARLLKVEQGDEPTEMVIHVNMLKEGWDVTNLYTIVPLRAANARTLIEQSIGRGLRLPYGKRTGIASVDRLNIVAHDRFQEIVDEANRPDSAIRLQSVILEPSALEQRTETAVAIPMFDRMLQTGAARDVTNGMQTGPDVPRLFERQEEADIARVTAEVIEELGSQPGVAPSLEHLRQPQVQRDIVRQVEERTKSTQLTLQVGGTPVSVTDIVARTTEVKIELTIQIPRILVVPRGEVRSGYRAFELDLKALNYQALSEELWVQILRSGEATVLTLGTGGIDERRLEDYVVGGLVDFDDVSYDDHAELLYQLAGQVVRKLRMYLSEEETKRVLRAHQRDIARLVHAQMQEHFWEEASGWDVEVKRGFEPIRAPASKVRAGESLLDFRSSPADKTNMSRYKFGGFRRCLIDWQKFDSDTERLLAVILDRDAEKWFRPALGQFQITYGRQHAQYQPDFVAETRSRILMLESKMRSQLEAEDVKLKAEAAVRWCERASRYAGEHGGKAWVYMLIPHDAVSESMELDFLVGQFGVSA